MKMEMKHTRLITLLLISFIILILITGFQSAADFFGFTPAVLVAAVLFCFLPLFRFIDTKLCVQMLN